MVLHDGINIYENNKDAMSILIKIIKGKLTESRLHDMMLIASNVGEYLYCMQNKHMRLFITLSDGS